MPDGSPVLLDIAVGPLDGGQLLPSDLCERGAAHMVTYAELIQIGILIVGIISLFMQVKKK